MEYHSANNETMPFATAWIDPEIIILNEVSQKKDKYHNCDMTYMWNLKNDTK